MPFTNGHEDGVVLVQAGSPISSLEPAMRLSALVGFCARLGSFCLLIGKGPENVWLTCTFVIDGFDAATEAVGNTNATAMTVIITRARAALVRAPRTAKFMGKFMATSRRN
jgi:hypothetical protein